MFETFERCNLVATTYLKLSFETSIGRKKRGTVYVL